MLEHLERRVTGGLSSLRVLLADDNPHMREIVGTLLRNVGILNIQLAYDGKQALACTQNWSPDIAIVDFRMEPMDGVEFTRQIRTAGSSRNVYLPIIMMTSHSALCRIVEARDAGVTEFIAKPINAQTLCERITSVIARPRPFVRSATFFGPCRRRRSDADYTGEDRRRA